MILFEWGMGGSTVWYANRVKHVYTVEHDDFYINKVMGDMERSGIQNVTIYHRPVQPLKDYAGVIKELNIKFNVIVVDGYAPTRIACLIEAIPFLKKDGMLVCDDFDHPGYIKGRELLKAWEEIIFHSMKHTTMIYKEKQDGLLCKT